MRRAISHVVISTVFFWVGGVVVRGGENGAIKGNIVVACLPAWKERERERLSDCLAFFFLRGVVVIAVNIFSLSLLVGSQHTHTMRL